MTKPKPKGPIPHGTNNGYSNYGCRCEPCKAACREYQRGYYERNAAKVKARARAWETANPERRNARARKNYHAGPGKDRSRAYYLANRQDRIDAAAAWVQANPDRRREIVNAWARRNPEAVRFQVELRRARKAAADNRLVTLRDWRRLCARHDNRCAYCGERRKLTQDHIIPIVRGGRHAIGNLIPACGSCNSSKFTRLLIEWKAARPLNLM